MAIVLGVVDADDERRAQAKRNLPARFSRLEHLVRQEVSYAGLDLCWEASPSTPVSVATDRLNDRERKAFVVGDYAAPYALPSDAAVRLLQRTAGAQNVDAISGQRGYYLAMLFDGTRLVLGTDVLGFFPLYYWAWRDVCLFGTSPQLFRCHPDFVSAPNAYAAASVLLLSYTVGGQSLFKGVRRNTPGCLVEWNSTTGASEREANPVIMSDAGYGISYSDTLDAVSAHFDRFHKDLTRLPHLDVSLSGGQDSRLVAAYVAKYVPGRVTRAISIGCRHDQELDYALKVSRALKLAHRYVDIDHAQCLGYAQEQIRLESLQGPFVSFELGTTQALLAEHNGPFISGYAGDAVIGDGHLSQAIRPSTGEIEFAELFRKLNRYGFSGDTVAALLSDHDGKAQVEAVISDLEQTWQGFGGERYQKAWLFAMSHRARLHVGSVIWRLSLGAWPLLPYYDRGLLDMMAGMPLNYLTNRRMQVDIIKRDFSRLATLPLDRNAAGPDYLVTPTFRKFVPHLADLSWSLYQRLERGRERRYYHRIFDFNNPGWLAVRQAAEPHRLGAGRLLNREAVDRLLPSVGLRPSFGNTVMEAAKFKTLLGLIMWSGSNFA